MRVLIAVSLACCMTCAWSTQTDYQKNDKAAAAKTQQASENKPTPQVSQPAAPFPSAALVKGIPEASASKQKQHEATREESEWRLFVGFLEENWDKVLMTVFNGVLAAFTLLLWRATDSLSAEARSSGVFAKAAADAANASATSMQLAERAYLRISFEMPGVRWKEKSGNGLYLEALVKNFGRTPAVITDIRIGIAPREHGDLLPAEFPFPTAERESIPNGLLVPQDHLSHEKFFGLRPESLEDIRTAAKRLWIFSHVDYIDTFGTRHRAGLARLYERMLEGRTDSTNLMLSTERRYDFDRKRKNGEGNDWGEESPT